MSLHIHLQLLYPYGTQHDCSLRKSQTQTLLCFSSVAIPPSKAICLPLLLFSMAPALLHSSLSKSSLTTPLREKYKVKDYSRLNQCSRRKTAFSIRQLLHPKVTMNPFALSLCIFSSSCLLIFTSQTQKEENHAPRRLVEHASRGSSTLMFFRRDSLLNTHTHTYIYIYIYTCVYMSVKHFSMTL